MLQIFELARFHGITVNGIADTEDDRVKVIFLQAPPVYGRTDAHGNPVVDRGPGTLDGMEAVVLGTMLVELGTAVKKGELRRNANMGEGGDH